MIKLSKTICFLLLLFLVACEQISVIESVVVDKKYKASYETVEMQITYIYNGTGLIPVCTPITRKHPEEWKINIKETLSNGKTRFRWNSVSKEYYDNVQVGGIAHD